MIHEIGVELQAALKLQGCPLVVIDGPERTQTTTFARERLVIEHDDGGDTFGPARSQAKNPDIRMIRNIGVKITIYAQEPAVGAIDFEHRRRAEHVLDMLLVALEKVALARKNGITFKSGKLIVPEDLAKSEEREGAVYELSFSIERAVGQRTWAGAIQTTKAIAHNSASVNIPAATVVTGL